MKIIHEKLRFHTKGSPQLLNITQDLIRLLDSSKIKKGNLTVFVVGSTAGITTFEYEPGLIQDVKDLYERIVPSSKSYHHDETWHDGNTTPTETWSTF